VTVGLVDIFGVRATGTFIVSSSDVRSIILRQSLQNFIVATRLIHSTSSFKPSKFS
jgi:hypothetical protein